MVVKILIKNSIDEVMESKVVDDEKEELTEVLCDMITKFGVIQGGDKIVIKELEE